MSFEFLLSTAKKRRKKSYDTNFRNLARLEEPEPPFAAKLLRSEYENKHKEKERHKIRRRGEIRKYRPIIHIRESEIAHKPESRRTKHINPLVRKDGRLARLSSRMKRHRTYCNKPHHRDERNPIEAEKELFHFTLLSP